MIILIPSYKRTDILPSVVKSVLNCDLTNINDRVLILIVNNYYPNKDLIESSLKKLNFPRKIELKTIHRKEAKIPIESWFSAIFSIAKENEVICLLGDDDIMLPWGLKKRFLDITESRAEMLLTDCHSHLYFYNQGKECWFNSENQLLIDDISPSKWNYSLGDHPNSSFISNHCYRNTKSFQRGYKKTMEWCQNQDWLPLNIATANFPFYLSYALTEVGGKVISSKEKNVIRGSVVAEALSQEYADGGNSAFYALLIYNTFSNTTSHLHDIDIFRELKQSYKKSFMLGALTILANKNISTKIFLTTLKKSKISLIEVLFKSIIVRGFNNAIVFLKLFSVFRGKNIKKAIKYNKFIPVEIFLEDLNKTVK
jgi:hypothetical protein